MKKIVLTGIAMAACGVLASQASAGVFDPTQAKLGKIQPPAPGQEAPATPPTPAAPTGPTIVAKNGCVVYALPMPSLDGMSGNWQDSYTDQLSQLEDKGNPITRFISGSNSMRMDVANKSTDAVGRVAYKADCFVKATTKGPYEFGISIIPMSNSMFISGLHLHMGLGGDYVQSSWVSAVDVRVNGRSILTGQNTRQNRSMKAADGQAISYIGTYNVDEFNGKDEQGKPAARLEVEFFVAQNIYADSGAGNFFSDKNLDNVFNQLQFSFNYRGPGDNMISVAPASLFYHEVQVEAGASQTAGSSAQASIPAAGGSTTPTATAQTASSPSAVPTATASVAPAPVKREPHTDDLVKAVQERLNALGYDAGKADGELGGKTVASVKRFQEASGMTVNGKIDQDLLEKLYRAEKGQVKLNYGSTFNVAGLPNSILSNLGKSQQERLRLIIGDGLSYIESNPGVGEFKFHITDGDISGVITTQSAMSSSSTPYQMPAMPTPGSPMHFGQSNTGIGNTGGSGCVTYTLTLTLPTGLSGKSQHPQTACKSGGGWKL